MSHVPPSDDPTAPVTPALSRVEDGGITPGTRLDKFVVLDRVGAGGMGTVFLAFDPELDRRVAIKLLHNGPDEAGGPEAARERLLQEAQAMARLQHPNVVTVLQTGIWRERVFLAMEYVDGDSLRGWLGDPDRSWAERLGALLGAGRGLAAAHAAGLVHRDFKPDNVLVGRDGRALVTDFGLASREGDEAPPRDPDAPIPELPEDHDDDLDTRLGSTQQGALVGTPAYMAPEQLMGQPADARSDQFAFAVTVWEAFTGERPFDLDGLRQLAITQLMSERGDAATPRTRRNVGVAQLAAPAGMPTHIHRALVTALSVDPARRFPSMEALLHQLANDPRVRRRQLLYRAAALVLALAGVGALFIQQQEARAARCTGGSEQMATIFSPAARAKIERAFLASEAPDAATQATRTFQELDAYAAAWAGMHHEACTATRVREVQSEEVLGLRMGCLQRRQKELASLIGLFQASPDAKLVDRAPQAVRGLPDLQACADVEALSAPVPLPPEPERRDAIRRSEDALAELEAFRAAGLVRDGQEAADALWKKVEALDYAPLSAETLLYRGLFEARAGMREESQATLTRAVFAADRGRTDGVRARSALWLARVLTAENAFDEAAFWLEVGEAVLRRTGGTGRLESFYHERQAVLLQGQGRYAEALEAWERATRAIGQERGPEAPERAPSLSSSANLLVRLGRGKEAIPRFQEALALVERERGRDHPIVIPPLVGLSTQQTESGDYDAALDNLERALSVARQRFGATHTMVANVLDFKATTLQARGHYQDSLEVYRASLAIREELLPPDSPDLSYSWDGIGQSLLGLGRFTEAREALEKALRLRGPDPFDLGETRFALARALWPEAGKRGRALELARAAADDYARAERADKAKAVSDWMASVAP